MSEARVVARKQTRLVNCNDGPEENEGGDPQSARLPQILILGPSQSLRRLSGCSRCNREGLESSQAKEKMTIDGNNA